MENEPGTGQIINYKLSILNYFRQGGRLNHANEEPANPDGVPAGAGGGHRIRLPRRHHPQRIRRAGAARLQGQDPPHPDRPRAGRLPRGRRLRPRHRQGGRVLRHLRPRRHQPDHRHRHRLLRLLPRGVHHRQRGGAPGGQGHLPGGGHHRHHHAHHQVQLPGAPGGGFGRRDPGGLRYRPLGPSGAGAHRHPEKRHLRRGRLRVPARVRAR